MKLIEEWRQGWKFWSVRLNALGSALLALLLAWPEAGLAAWNAMPAEVKALLPERLVMLVPLGVFAAAMIARFVKQEKLKEAGDGGE